MCVFVLIVMAIGSIYIIGIIFEKDTDNNINDDFDFD